MTIRCRQAGSINLEVVLKYSVEELMPSILRALGAPQPAPPPRAVYQIFAECLGIISADTRFSQCKNEIIDLFMELARHFINSGIDDSLPPPSATAKIPEAFGQAVSAASKKIADETLVVADEEFHNSPKFPALLVHWPRSDAVVDSLYRESLRDRSWEQLKALAQVIDPKRLARDLVSIEGLPDAAWETVYDGLDGIHVEDRSAIFSCISKTLLGRGDIDRLIDIRERTKWPEVESACIEDAAIDALVDAVEVEAPCRTANSNGLVSFDVWCEKIAPAGYAEDLFTTEEFCMNWGGGDVEAARHVRAQVLPRAVTICVTENNQDHSFWLDVIDRIATCDAEACRLARPDCVKILIERLFTQRRVSDCWAPIAVLFALGWTDFADSEMLPKLHTIPAAKAAVVLEQLGPLENFARPEIIRAALELSQAWNSKFNAEVEKAIDQAVSYEDQERIFSVMVDLVREDTSVDYSSLVKLLLVRLKNISVDGLAEDLLTEASLLRLVLNMRKGEVTSETRDLIREFWQPKLSSEDRSEVTDAAKVIEALGGVEIDSEILEKFSRILKGDDEAGVACLWKIGAKGEPIERERVAQITVVNDDTADLFTDCEDLLEKATLKMPATSIVPEEVSKQLGSEATPEWILTLLASPEDHPRALVDCGCARLCELKPGEVEVNHQTRELLQRGSLELWLWALHVDPAVLEEVDTRSVYDEVISQMRSHPIDDASAVGRALLDLNLVDQELLGWRVLTMLCMRGFEPLDEAAGRWLLPQVGRVISPILIDVETEESQSVDGVVAQYTPSTRELLGRKEAADGLKTELRITLPQDWPMAKANVKVSPIPGVPSSRNQKLALAVLREMTRAGMASALRIWSANVERIFDGVEPCVICYSIVSIDSNSLPNKQCRTCKNKFHSDCIYRWFRTSQKTTCPLCQSLF
ncbi:hypothetical protein FOZ63_026596 [Perkinsus olseni]|uniref:E3 ubiquitin-protein ligase listerin n=1 Tax=Perkinsus olseni TaxID=32597 RepID=A0A7J6T7U9_PEROL|nr:hypothetical protein FOZ63_026596 [Perkinsus olseni]